MRINFVAGLLFVSLQIFYRINADKSKSDLSNWECVNCGDPRNHQYIYGMVRRAMYRESREVYLNFDHRWIDEVLGSKNKVVVENVNRELLSEHRMPDMIRRHHPENKTFHETYYAVISLPSTLSTEANNLPLLPYREALKVDHFLTNNPCWMPLHDPPVQLYRPDYPIQRDVPDNSQLPTCDNHPELAKSRISDLFLLSDFELTKLYRYSAVFVRLPAMHFYATCLTYTLTTRNQFPAKCPTAKEINTTRIHHLSSIGWSHCVHQIIEPFVTAVGTGRVFYLPSTELYNQLQYNINVAFDGEPLVIRDVWKWADPFQCDNYTLAFNPWSCHFIPITNCTGPAFRNATFVPPNGSPFQSNSYQGDHSKYQLFVKHRNEMIKVYRDGPDFGSMWDFYRYLSFVQRPNIQSRAVLRQSLSSLHRVYPSSVTEQQQRLHQQAMTHSHHVRHGSHPNGSNQSALGLHQHAHSPLHWNNKFSSMLPCVGMHIRHGDSMSDWRGSLKLDRSTKHFGTVADKASQLMGTNNMFIATDNTTAIQDLANLFPHLNWFAQGRVLLNDSYTTGLFAYHNSESKKKDVCDLLADLILVSRCSSMIGSFDSGYANFIFQYLSSRNKLGRYSPDFERGIFGELLVDQFNTTYLEFNSSKVDGYLFKAT